MAGNKNSGRKTRYHELRTKELSKMCINWIIEKWSTLDKKQKVDIATKVGLKNITDKHEVDTNVNITDWLKEKNEQ